MARQSQIHHRSRPSRFTSVRSHFWLLLCALTLVLSGPACEDDVKSQGGQQPQAQGQQGGGGGGKKGGGRKGRGRGKAPAPGVRVQTDVLLPSDDEEAVPEPNPDAIYGTFYVASPWILSQMIGELMGTSVSVTQGDIARLVGQTYSLPPLAGVRWSGPALICFLDGSSLPMLVLEVSNRDELVDRLPDGAIKARQGNEFSFMSGPAGSVYLNFIDDHVVLTSNWKHYPWAREQIPKLLDEEQTALVKGSIDLSRYPALSDDLMEMEPPLPFLSIGWDEWREALDLVLGSVETMEVEVNRDSDAGITHLAVALAAPEAGTLRTLVDNAKPADPLELLAMVDQTKTRLWVWHDLRQDPLVWDGAAAATVSMRLGSSITPVQRDQELNRSRALAGPALLATGEAEAGTWTYTAANVGNPKRLMSADDEVQTSPELDEAELDLELKGDLVTQLKTEGSEEVAVELVRDDLLVGIRAASPELLKELADQEKHEAYLPKVLSSAHGKPLFLLLGKLAKAEEPLPPLALSLSVTDQGLELNAQLPDPQLEALGFEQLWSTAP